MPMPINQTPSMAGTTVVAAPDNCPAQLALVVAKLSKASPWQAFTPTRYTQPDGHRSPASRRPKRSLCGQERRLFRAVTEYRRNPQWRPTASGREYRPIETGGRRYLIAVQRVVLPSKTEIHVGYLEDRQVIFLGPLYHMELTPHPRKLSPLFSTLLLFIFAGILPVGQSPAAMLPALRQTSGSTYSLWHGAETVYSLTGIYDRIKIFSRKSFSSLVTLIKGLSPPHGLPVAHAQNMIPSSAKGFPYTAVPGSPLSWETLSQSAKMIPGNLHSSIPSRRLRQTETSSGDRLVTVMEIYFTEWDYSEHFDLPHEDARLLIQTFMQECIGIKNENNYALQDLLELDIYLGEKVELIVDRGLFYKNETEYFHTLMIKEKAEQLIARFYLSEQKDPSIKTPLRNHLESEIKVEDLLGQWRESTTLSAGDFNNVLLKNVLEILKNNDFKHAIQQIREQRKNDLGDNEHYFQSVLTLLKAMENAYQTYCRELYVDNYTPLERTLYKNNLALLEAFTENDHEKYNELAIQKVFFQIFEYTRSNGISIYSTHYLLPPQYDDNIEIFSEDEEIISTSFVEKIFTDELYYFIEDKVNYYPHILRLNNLIELFRSRGGKDDQNLPWHEVNLLPHNNIKAIYNKIIVQYLRENINTHKDESWIHEIRNIIHNDSITFSILNYLIKLQEWGNTITNQIFSSLRRRAIKNEAQRVAFAKIAAIKDTLLPDTLMGKEDEILIYEKNRRDGNIEILLKASLFWYFSHENHRSINTLENLNILDIIKKFRQQEHIDLLEFSLRSSMLYTSLYELKPSTKMETLDDYYNQFSEYLLHDCYHQARNMTLQVIRTSSLTFLDLVSPPREIFTFKVFSRSYLQNTMASQVWVLSPRINPGYLSLLKTESGKYMFISSLAGVPLIKPFSQRRCWDFYQDLKKAWINETTALNIHRRPKIPVSMHEIRNLFINKLYRDNDIEDLINFIFIKPMDYMSQQPAAEFMFVPIKQTDIQHDLLRSFYLNENNFTALNNKTSLTYNFDYLNQLALTDIALQLKESLREYTFIEQVLSFIPFFTILYRNWHDQEYQIRFDDVFFDMIDVTVSLFSLGIKFNHIVIGTLLNTLRKAFVNKIPRRILFNYVFGELISSLPELTLKTVRATFGELLSLVVPVPMNEHIFQKMKETFSTPILENVQNLNNVIIKMKEEKRKMRASWRSKVDEKTLIVDKNGIYSYKDEINTDNYIMIHDEFYKVKWNEKERHWIIVPPDGSPLGAPTVAIIKNSRGKWVADKKQLPDYPFGSMDIMHDNHAYPKLGAIHFEPVRDFDEAFKGYTSENTQLKKSLRSFTEKYLSEGEMTLLPNSNEKFLRQLAGALLSEQPLPKFMRPHSPFPADKMYFDTLHFLKSQNIIAIRYRALALWDTLEEQNLTKHIVLMILINDDSFVFDIEKYRPDKELNSREQIFIEHEWLRLYRLYTPEHFGLIKYKDFNEFDDARFFYNREAFYADEYVKHGLLLREPPGYKAAVIKRMQQQANKIYPLSRNKPVKMTLLVRHVRNHAPNRSDRNFFPIRILKKSGLLDQSGKKHLLRIIGNARHNELLALSFLANHKDVKSLEELIKINEGKLVAFFHPKGHLEYLIIALGKGCFAGAANQFFDPNIPSRVSLVIAEQIGVFDNGVFRLRHSQHILRVVAGEAYGSLSNTPLFADSLPSVKIPHHDSQGQVAYYITEQQGRERVLLGEDSTVEFINGVNTRLRIKMHGLPFNINHMDALDLADIIRGLPYVSKEPFSLAQLQSIELFSCYSGFGQRFSTGQILADALNIPVKAYPHRISEEIRARRPEWFRVYQPRSPAMADPAATEITWPAKTHQRLHDLMAYLHDTRRPSRKKRLEAPPRFYPPIYVELDLVIMRQLTIDEFIRRHDLNQDTRAHLQRIMISYSIGGDETDDIIDQAYLDILFSTPELNYLASWIFPLPG
ncbi:hypothetical protein [Martelella alba]|uniref:Uncharacterized protein n=1 Tax=Martelella alba TaxID=2590451 RepID=A0ABY2SRJ0_9HYPH|nr:hypothetical protein [Martelella alba]TKI06691.1 hypothetical protein FCN80_08835 [Martelella alba]